MTQPMTKKIFISHHHTDTPALIKLKKWLPLMGCEVFLAHEDTEDGEHDSERIEKELEQCDVFLYVGGEEANESSLCQKEIDMAQAQGKDILPIRFGDSPPLPEGLITSTHATECGDIYDLYYYISAHEWLISDETKKHLNALGCQGFSLNEAEDKIYLKSRSGWNDSGYKTIFFMYQKGKKIGRIKIARKGHGVQSHTAKLLPTTFPRLPDDCFSYFEVPDQELENSKIDSLRYLLNDITVLSEERLMQIKDEPVIEKSLLRQTTLNFLKSSSKI